MVFHNDRSSKSQSEVRKAFLGLGFTLYRAERMGAAVFVATGEVVANGGRRGVEVVLKKLADRFPNLWFRVGSIRSANEYLIDNRIGGLDLGEGRSENEPADSGNTHAAAVGDDTDETGSDVGVGGDAVTGGDGEGMGAPTTATPTAPDAPPVST